MSWRRSLSFLLLLILRSGQVSTSAEEVPLIGGRYVMGTVLEVTLYPPERECGQILMDHLFALAENLDRLFTSFDSESPLNLLNRQAGYGGQATETELAHILSLSATYWQLTHGAFDVTIGPLVELWQEAGRQGVLPSAKDLSHARARVGSNKLSLTKGKAELSQRGMSLNLGGIGKGYALDRLAETLGQSGVARALLNFGQSSLWAVGSPPAEDGWHVLVRRPEGGFVGRVTLHNQAFSVSSSLGQWTEINGQRYGHVIDPRSGQALTRNLQACVATSSAAKAEALSKALLILGEQAGIPLLEKLPDTEGMLIEAGEKMWTTSGWTAAVAFSPL